MRYHSVMQWNSVYLRKEWSLYIIKNDLQDNENVLLLV